MARPKGSKNKVVRTAKEIYANELTKTYKLYASKKITKKEHKRLNRIISQNYERAKLEEAHNKYLELQKTKSLEANTEEINKEHISKEGQ